MLSDLKRNLRALMLIAALVGALGAAPARADATDADPLSALQHRLDESVRMIEALTARVKELEARRSVAQSPAAVPAAAAAVSAAPAPEQRIADVEHRVQQIETSNATRQQDTTGLPIHGFADVGVGSYNPYFANLRGANIGSVDFYLTPKLGNQVLALSELIFEVGPNGHVGTDLERFQIGYQFSDAATVWLGRFHTPYGYVNTAFHHGVWLNDALRRPKFLNFEDHGGVLPAHTVGVWLTGAHRMDGGKFLYDVYAGNGQELQGGIVDMQSGGTLRGAAIAGTRLSYQFMSGRAEGLTFGVSGFTDKVNSQDTFNLTRLNVVGAYAVYDSDRWEHIAEAYLFHDTDLNGGTGVHRSNAWFAQFGYRASWGVPYIRYERASLDQADPYFAEQTFGASYYRSAIGVRFDLNAKAAIKFELARTRTTDARPSDVQYGLPENYNEAQAQYAIRF